MIIPLGSEVRRRRPTVVTPILIVATVAVHVLLQVADPAAPGFMGRWYLSMVLHADTVWHQPWTLISYAFLHGGLFHLLGNMVFLYLFGADVEDRLGRLGFLALYLLGAVAAGLAHIAVERDSGVVGASGAVAAVTGVYLVLFPTVLVRVLFFFVIIGIYSIPAWWFIAAAIAKDLLFQGLAGAGAGRFGGVAYAAHLGGYAFGATVAMMLLWARILPHEPYNLFGMMQQARRRREFAEIGYQSKMEAERRAKEIEAFNAALARRRAAGTPDTDGAVGPAAATRSGEGAPADRTADRAPDLDDSADAGVDPRRVEVAARRAELTRLAGTNPDSAAAGYVQLARAYADLPVAAIALPRRVQLDVANRLYVAGRHSDAADAYWAFAQANPRDDETPRVLVMAAVLYWRYAKDAPRARAALAAVSTALTDPEQHALAKSLQAELAAAPPG